MFRIERFALSTMTSLVLIVTQVGINLIFSIRRLAQGLRFSGSDRPTFPGKSLLTLTLLTLSEMLATTVYSESRVRQAWGLATYNGSVIPSPPMSISDYPSFHENSFSKFGELSNSFLVTGPTYSTPTSLYLYLSPIHGIKKVLELFYYSYPLYI